MSEKEVIVTLEDGFGRVQTKINTELSAPQLMDNILEIDEQQATFIRLKELNDNKGKKIISLIRTNKTLKEENEMLNRQKDILDKFLYVRECECERLKEKNEQLRKQIQNYKQLIANSYVGEEETLDGFTGKYVIWENELQKYKNKNEMIGDE